ncbi:intraflagellar transport-associated protein isoform 1-T3 [Molossus nigricans]
MDDDQIIEEVLDKFVNCHEQTYEEFLSTFTHLSQEDNVTKRGVFGTNSSENRISLIPFTHENGPRAHHPGRRAVIPGASPPCLEAEPVVLHEGQNVGSSFHGDLNRAGKVKVDNFLEVEDLDMDEEIKPQMNKGLPLLPGEAEQDGSACVPAPTPAGAQPPSPGVQPRSPVEGADQQRDQPRSPVKGADQQRDETPGDEVQPFRLDEEFDYDAVMLTPKFSPAEMEAIKELSRRHRENTSTPGGTL